MCSFRVGGPPQGLFEGHPVALQYLTPSLLGLYVDVEFTGSHHQFYDKMNIRYGLGQLLEYLWGVGAHRAVWRALASATGGGGGRGPGQRVEQHAPPAGRARRSLCHCQRSRPGHAGAV